METAKAISVYCRCVYGSALRFYDPSKRHQLSKKVSEEEREAAI